MRSNRSSGGSTGSTWRSTDDGFLRSACLNIFFAAKELVITIRVNLKAPAFLGGEVFLVPRGSGNLPLKIGLRIYDRL